MKVKELIEKLKDVDGELEVIVTNRDVFDMVVDTVTSDEHITTLPERDALEFGQYFTKSYILVTDS